MGNGTNALAKAIISAAQRVYDRRSTPAMLGRITSNRSLLLDDEIQIPNGDYLVVDIDPPIGPGDRVVCLPLLDGSEFVVIGRVK